MGELVDLGLDAAELEAMARMPPKHLVDMRRVYNGEAPATPRQEAFQKMMLGDFNKFISQLRAAEKEWGMQVAALDDPRRTGVQGPAKKVVDEGADRVDALIRELLEGIAKETEAESIKDGRCITCNQPVAKGFGSTSS